VSCTIPGWVLTQVLPPVCPTGKEEFVRGFPASKEQIYATERKSQKENYPEWFSVLSENSEPSVV